MSHVGLLIVTHGRIGAAMLDEAREILGETLDNIRVLPAAQCTSREALHDAIAEADRGDGVLVITDLGGASPANTALQAANGHRVAVVTGLNLPMLIRAWNYRDKALDDLARCTVEGARRGASLLR